MNQMQLDRNSETCAAQNGSRLGCCHVHGVCALPGPLAFLSFCGQPSLSPFLPHVTPPCTFRAPCILPETPGLIALEMRPSYYYYFFQILCLSLVPTRTLPLKGALSVPSQCLSRPPKTKEGVHLFGFGVCEENSAEDKTCGPASLEPDARTVRVKVFTYDVQPPTWFPPGQGSQTQLSAGARKYK